MSTTSPYITLAEMRGALNYSPSATYADSDIGRGCTAVSRALDFAARGDGSHFFQATETRYYEPDEFNFYTRIRPYGPEYRLQIDDIVSAGTVALDTSGDGSYATTIVQNTDFYLDPPNASVDSRPYEELVLRTAAGRIIPTVQRPIRITGTFGWPSVPVEVAQYAVFFVSQTVLRTRQAPFGILMQGMEVGATARLMRTDPDFDRFLGGITKRTLMI